MTSTPSVSNFLPAARGILLAFEITLGSASDWSCGSVIRGYVNDHQDLRGAISISEALTFLDRIMTTPRPFETILIRHSGAPLEHIMLFRRVCEGPAFSQKPPEKKLTIPADFPTSKSQSMLPLTLGLEVYVFT
ncbi:hypothetical protein BDZ97DRAFT_767957 [Flammula alnicola]|nr:hypothetical protein BDZ97DRAFT_767957 [Flammula alnicola]